MGSIRILDMKFQDVPLADIDLQDERFRFSYHFDLEKLLISIKKIGLINPLIVVKRGGPGYVIVTGWKRVSACLQLSMECVPVRLIHEQDDSRVFLFALYENWTGRNFSFLEKAEILFRLNNFIGDERKIVKEFFPLLEIPANLSYLDIYLKIARLDPKWKKVIFEKKIPMSSIRLLTEFSPEDRVSILPLIMPLNANKLKQFCLDLYELSKKTGDSPKVLLSAPEILSVRRSEKLSSLQKADNVRSLVHAKRYPTLSLWKKTFHTSLKKNLLSKDVAFEDSSFFEDGEFSVTFSLHDKQAFQDRISRLQELAADEDLFSLFNLDNS
jgi:ParB family chromosome partitioning protein